jgi:uncharacterized protein YbjT (DUF2867 family)
MHQPIVVMAGAAGNLGTPMAKALRERGTNVRGLVRRSTPPAALSRLRGLGVEPVEVDYRSRATLAQACAGASSVVSGLREVIIDAQTALLEAAVSAAIPRFIPSDYSIDFTRARAWNESQPGSSA